MAEQMTREAFEAEVMRLWPEANKQPLAPLDFEAMYHAHKALGLSVTTLVAGFAHAYESKYKR